MNHTVAPWRSSRPFFSGSTNGASAASPSCARDEIADLGEEGGDGAAAVARQLAADEVEALDAVGALVDHGDPGIADELLDAGLGDVAGAAEHLLRRDRIVEAAVGEDALDHRREQADPVLRRLARRRIRRAEGDVGVERHRQRQRPGGDVEAADRGERAPDVGVDDDRVGRRVGLGRRRPAPAPARRSRA